MICQPRPCIVCGTVFTPLQDRKKKCGKSYCYAKPKIWKRLREGRCRTCGGTIEPGTTSKNCNACREYQATYVREKFRQEKLNLIAAYGGKCACCGEAEPKFLTIDHIFNDGSQHRKELFGSTRGNMFASGRLYRWLRQNGYPKDRFQLLCLNCNCAKGHWGQCPHQSGRES